MSDKTVVEALRSDASLVVVEAPAGCGKTHQAADYAKWISHQHSEGHVLILTHTHAACDVFRSRTTCVQRRVLITTLDSLVTQISSIYHASLKLPSDTAKWARDRGNDGFEQLAIQVAELLEASTSVSGMLATRYPWVICDEHQDTNAAQHRIVMSLHRAGAKIRVFGDPVQSIFVKGEKERALHEGRWSGLLQQADLVDELDFPHRWSAGSIELGQWVLEARKKLKAGLPIMLGKDRPLGLNIIKSDNLSLVRGMIQFRADHSRDIRALANGKKNLMILAGQTATTHALNAFFYRSVSIWEGHTRDALSALVNSCASAAGNASEMAIAFVNFVQTVCAGFGNTAFATRFIEEVRSQAVKPCRGKPQKLQALAKLCIESPNHKGIGLMLDLLRSYRLNEPTFKDIKIDLFREYMEAIRLGKYDDVDQGLADLTRRRSALGVPMPERVISTIHKAKGLECDHVLMLPCDNKQYGKSDDKRNLMYVALSRAKCGLTIVASPANPSPWLNL